MSGFRHTHVTLEAASFLCYSACMEENVSVNKCTDLCVHWHVRMCVYIWRVCVCVYVCVYTCTHVYMHTYLNSIFEAVGIPFLD